MNSTEHERTPDDATAEEVTSPPQDCWPKFVNAYHVVQLFGGREEGGWWFDLGTPLESVMVDDEADLVTTLARLRRRYELDEPSLPTCVRHSAPWKLL